MKSLVPILVSLAIPLAAAAQQEVMSTAVVPVVGSVFGPNDTLWKTDVELINDTGGKVSAAIELLAVPGAAMVIDLGPGESQRLTDIVGQVFGVELALSPLRVTTGGSRSVTVRATAYAVHETTVSRPQPLATAYRSEYAPFRALDNVGFADEERTNVGLANLSDHEADFLLALQRVPGRDLAITHVTVAAESVLHLPIQTLFPLVPKGEHFRIVVETLERDTYVYASVIDNEQNASFIQARVTSR
jgi:hypothetical protein